MNPGEPEPASCAGSGGGGGREGEEVAVTRSPGCSGGVWMWRKDRPRLPEWPLRCQGVVRVAGHPWEPACQGAPVKALSSVGEEGGGGPGRGLPRAPEKPWRHWAPFPAGCGPDGSFVRLQRTEGAGGCPHLPGPRGQLQCPSVSECPPAAQAACESSDSTFKQRGRGFKPPSCLLQDLQTSQGRREGRGTHIRARKGGKAGSWGRSCIPQKLLSTHQELGIVLGPRETLRVRTDGIPALRALTLQQERSNSQLRTHVYVGNTVSLDQRI